MIIIQSRFKMTLFVHLLGSIDISRDGTVIPISGFRPSALLAYLMVTGQAHSRQHLVDLLFDIPADPKAALRWTLSKLQQAIGAGYILADRQQVAFNFEADYWLDVTAFEAGQSDLYQGDFLEGLYVRDAWRFEEWALLERERLRNRYQAALSHRLAAQEGQSDYAAVVETAHHLLRLDNLREEWYRALMRAYAGLGKRETALAQYAQCRRVLAKELGLKPAAETVALYEQIRIGKLGQPVVGRKVETPGDPVVGFKRASEAISFPPTFLAEAKEEGRPVFVAREQELNQLNGLLALALAGQGQVVFVVGEAGQGKTTLAQEFTRRAQVAHADLVVAQGNCNAYTGVGDPYLPFRDILELLTGNIEASRAAGAISQEQAQRLWRLIPYAVQALVNEAPDLIDVFIPARILAAEVATAASSPLTRFGPGRGGLGWLTQLQARQAEAPTRLQQSDLFEQYTRLLQALARQQPLLLFLDDLQWADDGSINLLFHLGRRLQGSRILIVGIYRPAEVALGRPSTGSGQRERHPLEPVVNEFQRRFGNIRIDLSQAESRQFVEAFLDSEPNDLRPTFREALYQHTGGHALFTVEIVRGLQERGDLIQDEAGRWVEGPAVDWKILPARIEGVIGERISRLPLRLQEALKVASVEGEEFTAEVAAQVIQAVDVREIVQQLSGQLDKQHQLIRSQGSQRLGSGGQRLSRYRFRHILFQRYLYSSLDDVEQVHLHEAVGNVLEQLYETQTEENASQLARHFRLAGIQEKAIAYLGQAGARAIQLSANEEATAHFSQALALLDTLPDTPEHSQQELSLQIALGNALIATKGFAAPEVGQVYARARELCQQVGATPQLFPALHGLYRFYLVRAEVQTACELGERCLDLAQNIQEPALLLEARRALGSTLFHIGDLASAREHLDRGMALYDPHQHHSHAFLYGSDPGMVCLSFAAWTLWLLGYPDQALEKSQEVLSLARDLAHPFSLAAALSWMTLLSQSRREVQRAQAQVEALLNLSTQQGFTFWLAMGAILQGWLLVEQGQGEKGIAQMRPGLAAWQATGAELWRPYFLALLARAYESAGQVEKGLAMLAEASVVMEKTGERMWEAELYRLKGELLLQAQDGRQKAESSAEACFLQAVELARSQQARSLELRAIVSLGRLWQEQGKKEEARQMLAEIYHWFSEGFDTLDLKEAKALLETLS